ncbi:MAG: murein biosynthesis integral membrane protein MurJ [Solirubrobacterales bacterium]
MTERGDGDEIRGEPPVPPEPFDPSTREFPAVSPDEARDPGRPFEVPTQERDSAPAEDRRTREAERIERRHEAVSMDTSTFMAIPAPTPTDPFIPPEFDEREGRLGRSTAFFSIATAFSRVAGLVREIVAASYFGINGPMSAFTIAFQVPNLVRSLFADAAIQAAFVPVFTEELEKGNKREAFRLASTLIYLVTLVLGAITAIFVLAAPLIVPIFAPGFSGEILDLTVTLSQILFPILIMLGATGMVVGVLNSYDRFAAFAISPFFWNVVIIAVLVLLAPAFHGDNRIYAYAIGVLIGTAVQLAIPAWDLRNTPFRPMLTVNWRIPEVRRVLLLMLPVTLSLGLINFDLLLNSIVGTLVSDQAPAAIDKAFRIYMLPQGIFSVAVATVTFPTLARFAARQEWTNLRSTMANGMRQILLLLIPAAAAVLVLSVPMTRLVYQRGEFDAAQTHLVAQALFWFAFSLPFNGLYLMLTRTFFSLQRPWVPTVVAGSNLVVDIVFSFALYSPFGVGGVVAATVIATVSSVVAQAIILRRQLDGLELAHLMATAARVVVAAALLAGVSYLVWDGLDQALGRGTMGQIISLGVALAAGFATYFGAVLALRVPEARQIMRLARHV